jgi:hypothetical protein
MIMCECTHSQLAEPMRTYGRPLSEVTIRSGHWTAQEKPVEVNAASVKGLATAVPGVWPRPKYKECKNKESHLFKRQKVCRNGTISTNK